VSILNDQIKSRLKVKYAYYHLVKDLETLTILGELTSVCQKMTLMVLCKCLIVF